MNTASPQKVGFCFIHNGGGLFTPKEGWSSLFDSIDLLVIPNTLAYSLPIAPAS